MFEWFKRKSRERSEQNILACLAELISVANQTNARIEATGGVNSADRLAVRKAKDALILQLCGPLPLDEVKDRLIEPVLDGDGVSEGARMAVNHAYQTVRGRIGNG